VGPLEGVSKSAFSAALMYEDNRWDAQLAADYSGEYVQITDAVGGLSQMGAPITWVTASVAYKVSDGFTVSLEGRKSHRRLLFLRPGAQRHPRRLRNLGPDRHLGVNVKF